LTKEIPYIKKLNIEKHDLLRMFEKHLVLEEEFNERLEKLEKEITVETNKELVQMNQNQNKKQEELEMAKEEDSTEEGKKVKSEETKKRGKKEQPNSYASIVAKVLLMKGIKNIDEAIAKVDELKPGMDKAKIKSRINAVIYQVQKQKQDRWKKYTWNKEDFLLTEK